MISKFSSLDKGSSYFISSAPIVHVVGAFYVVGGWSDAPLSTIGRFDMATRTWSNAGDLVTSRNGHNVIYDGNYLLVVGGNRGSVTPVMAEKCSITNGQVSCTGQTPQLAAYSYYPELFLVPTGFCAKAL